MGITSGSKHNRGCTADGPHISNMLLAIQRKDAYICSAPSLLLVCQHLWLVWRYSVHQDNMWSFHIIFFLHLHEHSYRYEFGTVQRKRLEEVNTKLLQRYDGQPRGVYCFTDLEPTKFRERQLHQFVQGVTPKSHQG